MRKPLKQSGGLYATNKFVNITTAIGRLAQALAGEADAFTERARDSCGHTLPGTMTSPDAVGSSDDDTSFLYGPEECTFWVHGAPLPDAERRVIERIAPFYTQAMLADLVALQEGNVLAHDGEKLSFRLAYQACCNFARDHGVVIRINAEDRQTASATFLNMYNAWDTAMKENSSARFWPFRRNTKVYFRPAPPLAAGGAGGVSNDSQNGAVAYSSIGQLNFYQWAVRNHVLFYVSKHARIIRMDTRSKRTARTEESRVDAALVARAHAVSETAKRSGLTVAMAEALGASIATRSGSSRGGGKAPRLRAARHGVVKARKRNWLTKGRPAAGVSMSLVGSRIIFDAANVKDGAE